MQFVGEAYISQNSASIICDENAELLQTDILPFHTYWLGSNLYYVIAFHHVVC